MRHRPHGVVVAAEVLRPPAPGAFDLGKADGGLQGAGDLLGDAVLQVEELVDGAVVARAPDMRAALGLDQLDDDAQAIADLLHAAFEQIGDAKLLADGARIGGAALVGEGRAARDHEKGLDAGQRRGDRFDDAVGEKVLARLRRHVVERQHDDGGLVGQRQLTRPRRGRTG